jgi:hypothetical protein
MRPLSQFALRQQYQQKVPYLGIYRNIANSCLRGMLIEVCPQKANKPPISDLFAF